MTPREKRPSGLRSLTGAWGSRTSVALYLDRCQIDTPREVVAAVWQHIGEHRDQIARVVDFGAGDGRFARAGKYREYVGYEIDSALCDRSKLPPRATLVNQCAFSHPIHDADVCVGNPPYVRNQDLPNGWRKRAANVVRQRTGVTISGLANAWQYFALLALASTKPTGLVALVIPYEWVSRPSAKALRDYIRRHRWKTAVYRLRDETFGGVLTTSSITIIDKGDQSGKWQFFEERHDGSYRRLASATGGRQGILSYSNTRSSSPDGFTVKRGLSPGTQEVLVLTEGERVRAGLRIGSDVVPCVTSLRSVTPDCMSLTDPVFRTCWRDTGMKCWLIRTDVAPSERLREYLDAIPSAKYCTMTCLSREVWWKFPMPSPPSVLVASGFRGARPKAVMNNIHAVAVGSVSGVYGLSVPKARALVRGLSSSDVSSRIVSHSNGLQKLEIGQLDTLLRQLSAVTCRP